jgi:hypothetical protein
MPTRDIRSNLQQQLVLTGDLVTGTLTITGEIFDIADYDGGAMLGFICTNYGSGTITYEIYESDADDMAGQTLMTADQLIGDLADTVTTKTTLNVPTIGIKWGKRYKRVVATVTGYSGSGGDNTVATVLTRLPEVVPAPTYAGS